MERVIKLSELKEISEKIFEHISDVLEVKEVVLRHDMYWNITEKALYDLDRDPTSKDINIGQLYDDLEFLEKILHDKDNAVPIMFIHLAPLLQYLATQIDWYD